MCKEDLPGDGWEAKIPGESAEGWQSGGWQSWLDKAKFFEEKAVTFGWDWGSFSNQAMDCCGKESRTRRKPKCPELKQAFPQHGGCEAG